ncbi:MAG: HTTM domain-containing protein, partial [Polyangiaceae bacterium]
IQARPALAVSSLAGLYTLASDRLQYHHNRYALLLYAFLLALTPCDKSWRLAGKRASADETGPMWAVYLARAQVSLVYLASGGSKLFDPDWRGGLMMQGRFLEYGYQAVDKGVPHAVVDFFSQPFMASLVAKGAIGSELFIACALWSKKLRRIALWWGMLFHLTIESTSSVELFTWVTLVAYAFFVTMDARARKFEADGSTKLGRFLVRGMRGLDWLSRFDSRTWRPDDVGSKHVVVVTRRDGKRVTGIHAWVAVAEATPILFPMWAPLALIASFRS